MLTCTPDTLRAPPAPEALTLQRVDAFSGAQALRDLAEAVAGGADVAARTTALRDGLGVLARIGSAVAGGGLFTTGPEGEARIAELGARADEAMPPLGPVIAAELARLAFRAGARRVVLPAAVAGDPARYAEAGFLPAA